MWTDGIHTVDEMKPTAQAVKSQEMSIKRAYELNAGLLDTLTGQTVRDVKRLWRTAITEHKKLRDLFDFGSPQWKHREVWEWTVDHWYSGGLRRSVESAMNNITETNRKAIKGKVDELYG